MECRRELAVKKNSVSMESVVNRGQHTVEEQQLTSTHHFGPERLRSNILITLIHAEKRTLMENESLFQRLCRLFKCLSLRISRKRHANEGGAPFHIHFCVLKKDASRYNTATKRIRNSFPEYEGRSLHVVFHRRMEYNMHLPRQGRFFSLRMGSVQSQIHSGQYRK